MPVILLLVNSLSRAAVEIVVMNRRAETGEYTNRKGQTVHLKEDLDWAVEHCTHYGDEFDFQVQEALKQLDVKVCRATCHCWRYSLFQSKYDGYTCVG